MSEQLGIGILCYYGADEVAANVASVREHCHADHTLMIFDNSENDEVGEWARSHAADALYVRSPYNVGCTRSRNHMVARFASLGLTHFVIQDQDVRWMGDAATAMRAVFDRYPDTGIATWHLLKKQMSPAYQIDETGVVPEIPGACSMYSMDCIKAVIGLAQKDGCPDCRAFNTRMFMFLWDTLFALVAGKAGYKTRLVWPDENLIRHDHPNQGIKRYPWVKEERARSRGIFKEEIQRHGLAVPAGLGV